MPSAGLGKASENDCLNRASRAETLALTSWCPKHAIPPCPGHRAPPSWGSSRTDGGAHLAASQSQ